MFSMQEGMQNCTCGHHKAVPVLIILIGLVFLLGAIGTVSAHFVSLAWPVLLILVGLVKMCGGMCKCCSAK